MLRRISTKWVLTVLAAVLIPFIGFAWFVDVKMAERQWDMVRYFLLNLAGDMAEHLDAEIRRRRFEVELWINTTPLTEWTIGEFGGEEVAFAATLKNGFDRFIQDARVFDLILAIDARGRLVVSSTVSPDGKPLGESTLAALAAYDFSKEPWFQRAMTGVDALVDHHESPLLPRRETAPGTHPENFHIGFAVPVHRQIDRERTVGVVYALMNWRHVQSKILKPPRAPVQGLVSPDIYHSCYAWLWMSDADTIIGHPSRDLYLKKVSQPPVNLPELVRAARSADQGMYPEYTFRGVKKSGAFKHCAGPEQGGLGWVVGVGVDNDDITVTIDELRTLLLEATLCALAVVIAGTVLIARHTTRPISTLQRHTQRIAEGDLETQVEVDSKDELGDLARAFNKMTHELKDNRAKLIKAEKDAAWREMARQVAHEIKNPLTPIRLSVALLKRAKDEKSSEFESIFERTVDLVHRQVDSMRAIAADFSAFAGTRKASPEVFDVGDLVREVLDLNAAWARELGVSIERRGTGANVFVDRGELRRVLINLVSNALEAMPGGGKLTVAISRRADAAAPQVDIEIRDTGTGLSEEVRRRLFEPYFTTRTHGTGLGLAIAARLMDEMNGHIEIVPVSDDEGRGTIARLRLPEHRA